MKKLTNLKGLLLMLFLAGTSTLLAQSSISGTVKDQNGELIPGVNIILKGTTIGTSSDFDGNYEIKNIKEGVYTLVASSLGFDNFTKEVNFNSPKIVLNIVIVENAQSFR